MFDIIFGPADCANEGTTILQNSFVCFTVDKA
jgi:hypothetical protein